MRLAITLFMLTIAAHAAVLEGRWSAQAVARGKKTTATPVAFTLELKNRNGRVTGAVWMDNAKKPRPQNLEDVVVDGDTIRFTTHAVTKKSNATFLWTATFDGDKITGTRSRDGAKGKQQFTGKRMSQ